MTLEDVLRLHALGFSVIPLKPGTKQPALPQWEQYQTTRATEVELRTWFGNGVRHNAGIPLGQISGVVVIESDTPQAEEWCATHLPPTPMRTRSARGFHYYYRVPTGRWAGVEIPASITVASGVTIEIKRHGQYVVAPGSIHPSGHVYEEATAWPTSLDVVPEFPMDTVVKVFMGTPATASPKAPEPLPDVVGEGGRNTLLFREACRLRRLGWQHPEILNALTGINGTRCDPPLGLGEIETIARSAARYEAAADTYPLTETGNAEFFVSVAGEIVRFDHGRRRWFVFDGHHWILDGTDQVDRLALDAIRARQAAATKIDDGEKRKARLKWAIDSESRARRESTVRLAAKQVTIAVTGDDWDRDPLLLGVQNGVVDLRTGALRDGRPTDNVTKVTPTSFDAGAKCPRWNRFLREIFADHPEIADYAQRVIGYSLTGLTDEQVFWILWGLGANGKSTLMEILMRYVLGEAYAWTMPFPAAGWSNAMSEYQKASMVGQRMVAASEVTRSGCLNEELIKSLTGGDTINARHPYGRPFQYVPVAKIFLRVNDKPVIRDQSHGMWRRVKLVPFTQTFAVDTTLAGTLAAEAPGILAWAVRGCLDWQRDGLRHPDVVEAATVEYRNESDTLTEFINEQCVVEPNAKVGGKQLFEGYRAWCDGRQLPDVDRLNQTAFGLRIKERFRDVGTRTVMYEGIGLRARSCDVDL